MIPKKPIYLDYHATTPVDKRVVDAMLPYFTDRFGNAASRSHSFGWQADEAVNIARQQVADLIHCDSKGVFFTSGATEGLNMLIKGTAFGMQHQGRHIISVVTEHAAVLDVLEYLNTKGFEITLLPVQADGTIDLSVLEKAFRKDTILVSAMWANNETGVIHDISSISAICKKSNIPFITDATQAIGKVIVDLSSVPVPMMAFSAHKFYGPKGIGAVFIDPALKFKPEPLIHGGGHEHGLRSGTLNVPGIVGMGMAAQICHNRNTEEHERIRKIRDEFENAVLSSVEGAFINGHSTFRLTTVSNICIPFTDSQAVITRFRNKLAISSGSACSSADPHPSHVLLAMGLNQEEAKASYRFSFGLPATSEEADQALTLFLDAIRLFREESPQWRMYKEGIIRNTE